MPELIPKLAKMYRLRRHPIVEELVAAQGLIFPRDPRELMGDFCPEEESIEDFLAAMRE
jgi:hypothetical protein